MLVRNPPPRTDVLWPVAACDSDVLNWSTIESRELPALERELTTLIDRAIAGSLT
jgi:hypothetical protein|tara:strand:+ start:650 stop:814 length:165 start_codon:yes stop_codon:yes gene_type:complete